jgi:hypothetical protein
LLIKEENAVNNDKNGFQGGGGRVKAIRPPAAEKIVESNAVKYKGA